MYHLLQILVQMPFKLLPVYDFQKRLLVSQVLKGAFLWGLELVTAVFKLSPRPLPYAT